MKRTIALLLCLLMLAGALVSCKKEEEAPVETAAVNTLAGGEEKILPNIRKLPLQRQFAQDS